MSRCRRTAITASARRSASVRALYADKHGLRVTCLRIGNVGDAPAHQRQLAIWLKPEDLVQLIRIGLEHRDIHFEIFYGASDNADAWWTTATPGASAISRPEKPMTSARRRWLSKPSCRRTRSATFIRAGHSAAMDTTGAIECAIKTPRPAAIAESINHR